MYIPQLLLPLIYFGTLELFSEPIFNSVARTIGVHIYVYIFKLMFLFIGIDVKEWTLRLFRRILDSFFQFI